MNNTGAQGAQFVIYQPRSLSHDALFGSAEPLEGINALQILSLVSTSIGPGYPLADWRTAIHTYFLCVHPWYAAVHPTLFERQITSLVAAVDSPPPSQSHASPGTLSNASHDQYLSANHTYSMTTASSECPSKEVALLVVAMYLTTRMRLTDAGELPIFDETYRTVKRLLSSLLLACVGDPRPSIELVQCGALVALYEYGHGNALTAYRTLSQTVVTARILDIKPGQLADTGDDMLMLSVEEEQSSCLWWSMFILEQFIHQDDEAKGLPFLLETPTRNTLLPETPPLTPSSTTSGRFESPMSPTPSLTRQPHHLLRAGVIVGKEPLGRFQLSAKSSSLFHRAIRIDKERDTRPGKMPLVATYSDLDHEIREATLTLLRETLDWESTLDCFAMLVSALFTLYVPYLSILEHSAGPASALLESSEEVSTALAALRFACKLSTDISCKVNADFERAPRSPALLCAPAGATCYHVISTFAALCRIFPDEHDVCHANIAEKFESLALFSFRWGIAENMMARLEKKYGLDRQHYLKNSLITPPPHAICFDFARR